MAQNIAVPDIGDFENVEIIEVLVEYGSSIKKNDPIVTLESDKSSVEVPSPFSGKISSLKVKVGDKVSKGSILALIENEEKTSDQVDQKVKEPLEKKIQQKDSTLEEEKNTLKNQSEVLPETEKIIKEAELHINQEDKKDSSKKI